MGKRIRQRRKIVNMSQGQLGDKLGVLFQQIQKYESGENRVSAARLWRIAEVLEVPMSYFYEGLSAREFVNQDDLEIMQVTDHIMRLTPPARKHLLAFLRTRSKKS